MRSTLLTVVLTAVGIMGGSYLDKSTAWVIPVCIAIIVVGTISIGLSALMDYRRMRPLEAVHRAERWAREREDNRTATLLNEFWDSPQGKHLKNIPYINFRSARIVRIGSEDPVPTYTSRLTYQLDDHCAIHIEVGGRDLSESRLWSTGVVKGAIWLVAHTWFPDRLCIWIGRRLGITVQPRND